jgi:hypothetical protein
MTGYLASRNEEEFATQVMLRQQCRIV